MKNRPTRLDELEARFRALIEVKFLGLFPNHRFEDRISLQLAAALHDNPKEQDGTLLAPNEYIITANEATLSKWHAEPGLLEDLAEILHLVGTESGFQFPIKPTVHTAVDNSVESNTIRVLTAYTNENVSETRGAPAESDQREPVNSLPKNAFLIINGTKIATLNRSVINIGRRLDNHIVVDDPRVSRCHAQLRFINGRFLLFDLNSKGGSFVNGERINQAILHPGDVISLAGATFIFNQDMPEGNPSTDQTEPGSHIPAEGTDVNRGSEEERGEG